MDLTTLRLMMEALKRSSNVDTLTFHNAGLTDISLACLAEGLQHTTVQCLGLDYNTAPSPTMLLASSHAKMTGAGNEPEGPAYSTGCSLKRNFASLVGEGTP